MAKLLTLRFGVSDDPMALQPSLADCLEAALQQAEFLMSSVLDGLVAACAPTGARRVLAFQQPGVRAAIEALRAQAPAARKSYRAELGRAVYQGGGKEQPYAEALRFEDLKLFEDAELDQSIEQARALQQVSLAVDDVLPSLDALISTLLGWRTAQPGLNPLRPEVFVRALQACLAEQVPDGAVREALITPAAGVMGVQLRKLYRELVDWLRSAGVEPAVPVGGRPAPVGSTGGASVVADSMAKTLLTLDRLRKLLAGDLDTAAPAKDFLHTVPASLVALQDLKQVDALVKRLEERPKPSPEVPAEPAAAHEKDALPRLGHQLGGEVVRLMFDNLAQDARLVPEFRRQLRKMEPAVLALAKLDSRFFSDRTHPARQFLDRLTQRSLAFASEADEGWPRFLASVEQAALWLDSKVVDADTFGELTDLLHEKWSRQDESLRTRREEAAKALLQAEQRNLLAQKLAAEFAASLSGLQVAGFVADFLKGSWSQVVAQAQIECADGSDDPFGYRAVVEDLVWSVQRSTARKGRQRRLAEMLPGLLAKLREGLARIDYPPELTERFFGSLVAVHEAALREGREGALPGELDVTEAAVDAAHTAQAAAHDEEAPWLASQEAAESGYLPEDSFLPEDAADVPQGAGEAPPLAGLRTGTWVELSSGGQWIRVQLTWASPHATLFMFTSLSGSAHSMSRRTLDRLRAQGLVKIVAGRHVLDEALDQVAKTALKNSLDEQ